ncbi:hypothetical protein [Vagococcus fluvialis]|uniref:hypothetical protein n=1 Tax=Vagococcus fluvialis TaxID=2738 RepID=UPI001D0BB163|nr:hypothetical protein [Vagococcus fluvialis]UDM79591.1 hypothetical protein K5K97_13000 [Vagococcus fluvialis]
MSDINISIDNKKFVIEKDKFIKGLQLDFDVRDINPYRKWFDTVVYDGAYDFINGDINDTRAINDVIRRVFISVAEKYDKELLKTNVTIPYSRLRELEEIENKYNRLSSIVNG